MNEPEAPIVISREVLAALPPLYKQIALGLENLGKVQIEDTRVGCKQ